MVDKIVKPNLATALETLDDVVFPVWCSEKLDGIRAMVVSGKLLTRTFKAFPNTYIREQVGKFCLEGFDGEIIVRGKPFSEITHDVMREDGEPNFTYAVFDWYSKDNYVKRMERLEAQKVPKFVEKVLPTKCNTKEEVLAFEKICLAKGAEGVMLRNDGPYKFGRSSVKEGGLLKWKRMKQDEAVILEIQEQMENTNEKTKDAFGRGKRSSAMEGLVPANTMGAIQVKDLVTGIIFCIGTGFDAATRNEFWKNKAKYIGKIVTYRHQTSGAKTAPRFPSYVGIRSPDDI
jgi:DNA ligase-1